MQGFFFDLCQCILLLNEIKIFKKLFLGKTALLFMTYSAMLLVYFVLLSPNSVVKTDPSAHGGLF